MAMKAWSNFLHQVLPETLKTASGDGLVPAHLAAQNGHEGVVQCLHQVLPETLKTAAGDGDLPAHLAAMNGHEGLVQFLHQVCPETLKAAGRDGDLPAHLAAGYGHEGVLRFLHQVVPETLKTANGNGKLPAHLAAEMAMKEWSNFSTKWFLTLLQLHPDKMLRCACLMKMTVANLAYQRAVNRRIELHGKSFTISPAVSSRLKVKDAKTKLEVGQSGSRGSRHFF